ncbi:MAG: PepSY-associated TM helix domain-containing protein [Thermodesulfobacteriota bacterium]
MKLLRTLHRWGGLLLSALAVFYCLTGVLMNHRAALGYFQEKKSEKKTVAVVETAPLTATIGRYVALTGEPKPPGVVKIRDDDTVELLYGSHGAVTYVFPPGTGEMEKIVKTPSEPWYRWNVLHKAAGTGTAWLTLADFTGGALLAVAATGLFLIHWRRGDWLALLLGCGLLLLGVALA